VQGIKLQHWSTLQPCQHSAYSPLQSLTLVFNVNFVPFFFKPSFSLLSFSNSCISNHQQIICIRQLLLWTDTKFAWQVHTTMRLRTQQLKCVSLLLLLVCVSWTITGQPWNSVFICRDHCCRGRSKPSCQIVGSHTRWEFTTWADVSVIKCVSNKRLRCNAQNDIKQTLIF